MDDAVDSALLDAAEQDADRAAARGDLPMARRLLDDIVARAPGRIDTWLKLAAIRRANGNLPGALAAVSAALRVDPLHFMALLSRARLIEGSDVPQDAGKAYGEALAQLPEDITAQATLRPLIEHAKATAASYRNSLADQWNSAIVADPALSATALSRLQRFKSNALRDTRVYHSEPTHYHYPGLVEREFHDRHQFAWLETLERATSDIMREFDALIERRSARAEPYVQYADDAPVRQWSALNHSLDWTAFHLLKGGHVVAENADHCPATMAVVANIPQPRIANRSPNAMFSLLRPNTRIPPHTGVANTRLVCHLPLIVPERCWFRVGAERREWRVGEAFVFDDTIEHEAANDSDDRRVVLIIDLWHPGLDAEERAGVTRAMEADDAIDTPL